MLVLVLNHHRLVDIYLQWFTILCNSIVRFEYGRCDDFHYRRTVNRMLDMEKVWAVNSTYLFLYIDENLKRYT